MHDQSDSNTNKVAAIAGLAGALIVIVTCLIAAFAYTGDVGQSYSFFNHNISELGEIGVSDLAAVFNVGLMVGGLCLLVFVVALARLIGSLWFWVISVFGILAAVGIVLVGVFPVDPAQSLIYHTVAALMFFLSGLVYSLATAIFLLASKQEILPRWLSIPSFIVSLSFVAFLFLPRLLYQDLNTEKYLAGPSGPDRPDFWLPSFLEWLILFTFITWVLIVAAVLWRRRQ